MKITRIRVQYQLKIPKEKTADAQEAFSAYLVRGPAAQNVIGCTRNEDKLTIEEEE